VKAAAVLKNPHLWFVLVVSIALLLIYQAWPWREWQFVDGAWRFFSWLSIFNPLVVDVELRIQVFGVLFFLPIIYGSITLSWPGGILAWLLSLVWMLPALSSWGGRRLALNLLFLLLPVLVVAVINGERRWREAQRRHYATRERERRAYVAQLVAAQEAERQRIAQEIHDETLQTLMVIANKSDSLASSIPDPGRVAQGLWIKNEVLRTMDGLRRLSMDLRPSVLDNFGLVSGIRWLVNNSNTEGDCRVEIHVSGTEQAMSGSAEATAFRIAQEAIHNVHRHSHATRATVTLTFDESELTLEIKDNGIGFQPPERLALYVGERKLGMIGIEQRVESAGGVMSLESGPGAGTTISVTIPYTASATEHYLEEGSAQPRSSRVRMPDFRATKTASVRDRTFSFWNTSTK
jgi:signal transduction histidine kinase